MTNAVGPTGSRLVTATSLLTAIGPLPRCAVLLTHSILANLVKLPRSFDLFIMPQS